MKIAKTTIQVELSAAEVTKLLVPAAQKLVNADGKLGKLTGATAAEAGGLSATVTMVFEPEAKADA